MAIEVLKNSKNLWNDEQQTILDSDKDVMQEWIDEMLLKVKNAFESF